MCELHISSSGNVTIDTLFRLLSNSPGSVLFPKLETLLWDDHRKCIPLTFSRLFLSPRLRYVGLYSVFGLHDVPRSQLEALAKFISSLPTSLQDLYIMCNWGAWEPLQDAVSSFVCRCGQSLRSLNTRVPLSEAAVHHLTRLPNLHRWMTVQGPPPTVPTSMFPSLEYLDLDEPAALPWIHLLASHEEAIPRDGFTSAISHSNIRETLQFIYCRGIIIIDSKSLPSIVKFRNLVELCLFTDCLVGNCTFRLTDHDMETLTAALPRLKAIQLGFPCNSNLCDATVASLMSISLNCLDLTVLETHFNTLEIVSDMRRLLDGGAGRGKAKCKLQGLSVGYMPLEAREEDIETIAMGFTAIFPCLVGFLDVDGYWYEVGLKLGD